MATMIRRAAAVTAAAALAVSTATGVANAQSGDLGSVTIDAGTDLTGNGSVDTTDSLIGEPTSGSLAGFVGDVIASTNTNSLTPAEGTGSVETTNSSLGEPTSGSLLDAYAPLAGSLGTGEGFTAVLSSEETNGGNGGGTGTQTPGSSEDDMGAALAVVAGIGAIAAISAGIYVNYPQIQAAAADAGIELPPLP